MLSSLVHSLVGIFVVAFCSTTWAHSFPEPIEKCLFNDEKCLVKQATEFLNRNPHGIPELGFGDLETIELEDVHVRGDRSSPAYIDMKMTKVFMHGYSEGKFISFRGFERQAKPMTLAMTISMDKLRVSSQYTINGKILLFAFKGIGDLNLTMSGVTTKCQLKLRPKDCNGKVCMEWKSSKIVTKFEKINIAATNDIKLSEEFHETLLKILNDNAVILSADVEPQVNLALGKTVKANLNNFFENVPYDDWFLASENV